jgi:hypothetical protein
MRLGNCLGGRYRPGRNGTFLKSVGRFQASNVAEAYFFLAGEVTTYPSAILCRYQSESQRVLRLEREARVRRQLVLPPHCLSIFQ